MEKDRQARNANYEYTIHRIVAQGFRFGEYSMNGLYDLYRGYIENKETLSDEDRIYLELYPKLKIMKAERRKKRTNDALFGRRIPLAV